VKFRLRSLRASQYDPTVVDACPKLFRDQGYVIPA